MSYVSDRFPSRYPPQPAAHRMLSLGAGGAMFGAMLAGTPGFVVGGVFGLAMARYSSPEDRRRASGDQAAD